MVVESLRDKAEKQLRTRFKIVVSLLGHWGVNLRYPNMVSNMFFWVENHAKGHFRTYEYKNISCGKFSSTSFFRYIFPM